MGHNLEQLGTASLDCMGGFYTNANPQDLPEGASPRVWDCDFAVGSVFTRAGLASVYTYTQVLTITQVVVGSTGMGTFTYTGKTPTINEAFVLSDFIGQAFFLNGQTVVVISVNPIGMTFMADVTGNAGAFTNILGTATSTTGDFLGPNVPTSAVATGTGNAWVSPANILGNTGYASVSTGASGSVNQVPLLAGSLPTSGATAFWINPNLITSTGAHITLTAGQIQDPVVAYRGAIALPANATVTGLSVTLDASCSVFGVGSINVQLVNPLTNYTPYGTAVNKPLSTVNAPYTFGSASYQWGTTLTPANVNGSDLGVMVSAVVSSGTATISVNTLAITVTYVLAGSSQAIQTTVYAFSVPATAGITGLGVSFQAYTSSATSVTMQLLQNGVAVGQPKTQALTTTPTIYQLGTATDLWGATWLYSDINNTQFGVLVTASGLGTTFVNDMDVLTYISPALVNFNYIKSYIQNNGQTDTLALDASGIMWKADVTNAPSVLSASLSGILPGSFAKSATMDDREHICFSDLSVGTERPRVFNGVDYRPLSQTGPGAPPTFAAVTQSSAPPLVVTAYSISANIVTFTFNTAATAPVVGALYTIEGTGNSGLDGTTVSVIATPSPSTTQFSAGAPTATGSATGLTATATPTSFYSIASLTQDSTLFSPIPSPPANYYIGEAQSLYGQIQLWSSGPGQRTPGFTITLYYGRAGDPENAWLLHAEAQGYPIYVFVSNAQIGNGLQLVSSHGTGTPPSETGQVPFITFQAATSNFQWYGGVHGTGPNGGVNGLATFQVTMATITMANPVFNMGAGSQVTITGATPSGWNSTWTILAALDSGIYAITSSQMGAGGVVTFTYNDASGGLGDPQVTNGYPIQLQGLNNPSANLNTIGIVSAATATTFQVAGFPGTSPVQSAPTPENGQGQTFGTKFIFDPGATFTIGSSVPSPIFGDSNPTTATIQVIGGTAISIGPGIRQGVCFFITDNEYETQVSSPFTFTVPEGATQIVCSNLPIGPPNVIARGLAFTEAGQNGVPGANFYVIETPVTTSVDGVTVIIPSTIINDNTTSELTLAFTDAVLLNSREIDIPGDNLFNFIELGSCAWCVPYAGRMFYGLQLNKIDNWTSGGGLTFDGGYLAGVNQPLGWNLVNSTDQTLISSPVTGQALYIKNVGAVTSNTGMIYQTAYQDAYLQPIINTNTTYSVRVACSAPSGSIIGALAIDLTDYTNNGFGTTYGSFTVPLSSMTTNIAVFTGNLLTNSFPNAFSTSGVSPNLQIRVYVAGCGVGADCLIDRIEVYPTNTPYLKAQVYGSYPNQPEAIDGSSTGGIIDTTTENAQPVMGGFVMHNLLYLLKTNSWYSVQDNPNSEPGGWGINEVSNKVGAIGINSYDVGEEWCVTACRAGIFGFNGGQPIKIMQELWNLWEQINWNAGQAIVLRNDIVSKRLYCAIPLPTGVNPATGLPANKYTNVWLPNAPYNPTPTTPNVMLMLNYQGLATFEEMVNSPEVHTTISHIVLPTRKRRIESREFRESPHCGQS